MTSTPICKRCFQPGHTSEWCLNEPTVACSRCFRLNFFTVNCCEKPDQPYDFYQQAFRISGTNAKRFYIDAKIFGFNVPALINTGLTNSRIDINLAAVIRQQEENHYEVKTPESWTIRVPIQLRNSFIPLDCDIHETVSSPAVLELGLDYLTERPFRFEIERQLITRFQVPISIGNTTYSALVHTGRCDAVIDKSLLPTIYATQDLNLAEEMHPSHKIRVPFVVCGQHFVIKAHVRTINQANVKMVLGMDFVMNRNCTFKLDNITLNTYTAWVTRNPYMIEFVHQHEKGTLLKRHLLKQGLRLPTNYSRDPICRTRKPTNIELEESI